MYRPIWDILGIGIKINLYNIKHADVINAHKISLSHAPKTGSIFKQSIKMSYSGIYDQYLK